MSRQSWARPTGLVAVLVLLALGAGLALPGVAADGGQTEPSVELSASDESVVEQTDIRTDSQDNTTDEADIQLTEVEGPDTLDPGEPLEVSYSIKNAGDAEGTESAVQFVVNGEIVDSATDVTLGAGEAGTAPFVYASDFELGSTVSYRVQLATFGDSVERTVDIGSGNQSGALALDDPIQTDSVSVLVEVTSLNTLDGTGWLAVENLDNDVPATTVPVETGDVETFSPGTLGGFRLNDTVEARLGADSEFSQLLDTDTTTVTAGDNAPIATFESTPPVPAVNQTVIFDASNAQGEGTGITEYRWDFTGDGEFDTVTGSQTTTYAFQEGGEQEVRLVVENGAGLTDEFTASVVVEQPPAPPEPALSSLDIAGQGDVATVQPGQADISMDVTNVGEVAGNFTVTLTLGDEVTRLRTTSDLGPEETTTLTFSGAVTEVGPGAYVVTATAADAAVNGTLTVDEPSTPPDPPTGQPSFTVDLAETNSPVSPGENLTVTVEVANIGNASGTETVTLDGGALGSTEASVTLDGGASTETTLTLPTTGSDTGEYNLTADVGNSEIAVTVTLAGGDGGSSLVPILLVLLIVGLLVGVGVYYYYTQQQSGRGMDSL
jgi:hypothetical protein